MEKFHPKTTLANILDHLFRVFAAWLAATAWFVFLWGVQLSSLAAGAALGAMLWICLRQFAKHTTRKREQQLRRMIGGELAVERLLLETPRKAVFQAALWIASRYPVEIEKATESDVFGTLEGRPAIIRLIAQHKSQPVTAQQMVECARETQNHAAKCLLCTTAPVSREAADYAAGLDPPIPLIRRDELIQLAGFFSPATDEELQNLARRKRTRHSPKEWLAVMLDSSRARRYCWYGTGMALLAYITGSGFYPVPAILCLTLYAACKIHQWIPLTHQTYRRWRG